MAATLHQIAKAFDIDPSMVSQQEALMWAREDERRFVADQSGVFADSYQNWAANVGIGTGNLSSFSTYGFNPISRQRTLVEFIYRGSWIGGVAVDVIAEDMTRAGASVLGGMEPEDIKKLDLAVTRLQIWSTVADVIRWARLYGGAIGVYLVDGDDPATPLNIQRIGKGKFKGLLALDQWMLEPYGFRRVKEYGPDMGKPEFYRVTATAPAFTGQTIHHSRIIRVEGDRLPYWQAMMENGWGLSVFERLYDRLTAFDSTTQGAAQLVYKAHLRTMKIKGLREIASGSGSLLGGVAKYVDYVRKNQSNEGMTMLDADDDLQAQQHNAFGGLAEVLVKMEEQLAGALGIPVVRLFGQSPSGLNATGDYELRMYYDNIRQKQEQLLMPALTRLYMAIAVSERIRFDESFSLSANPLWQIDDKEKGEIAKNVADTVQSLFEATIIDKPTALRELAQVSKVTGIFTNVTDDVIQQAEDEPAPEPEMGEENKAAGKDADTHGAKGTTDSRGYTDSTPRASRVHFHHGLDVAIENPEGSIRRGRGWEAKMPSDYGFIRGVIGADGDQLDCFLGTSPESPLVYVADMLQRHADEFDEHKIMLGYASTEAAMEDLHLAYPNGGPRIGSFTEMSMQEFKRWIASGEVNEPYSDDFDEKSSSVN